MSVAQSTKGAAPLTLLFALVALAPLGHDNFGNIKLKVMLREDIWRKLKFENKSHLLGRSVSLAWKDKADFFKVVLKQALNCDPLLKLVKESGMTNPLDKVVGDWSEDEVFNLWNIIVGERMKGGRTAFTRNWVWNRLADANGDHSPRYLLALFNEAIAWEKKEQVRSPYNRTIIRPRALIKVLEKVSEQALGALKDEEFQELAPLFSKLEKIGKTPFPAQELEHFSEWSRLAVEVGLLGAYETSGDHTLRYFAPELFRLALKMKRHGQA